MSVYEHADGGTYRRLPHQAKVKLSGGDWVEVVLYESTDLECPWTFGTDEARWAERFRERPAPTPEEWAEACRGLDIDWSTEDSDEDTPEQNPHRCSDGGCILLVPGAPVGMSTNGGCRCLKDPVGATRVRVRKGIRWLAERVGGEE